MPKKKSDNGKRGGFTIDVGHDKPIYTERNKPPAATRRKKTK